MGANSDPLITIVKEEKKVLHRKVIDGVSPMGPVDLVFSYLSRSRVGNLRGDIVIVMIEMMGKLHQKYYPYYGAGNGFFALVAAPLWPKVLGISIRNTTMKYTKAMLPILYIRQQCNDCP